MLAVLYIHHDGIFGGASRSLFETIRNFPEGEVRAFMIAQKGQVARMARELGITVIEVSGVSRFDNNLTSYYSGFRWMILLREICYILPTIAALRKAKAAWGAGINVIHVNDYFLMLPIVLAKRIFKRPVVVHTRAVQQKNNGLRHHVMASIVKKYADRVIAIDRNVEQSLAPSLNPRIIHNGLSAKTDAGMAPKPNTVSTEPMRVGIVANFLRDKGVREFVEAANICINEKKLSHIEFVIFGDNTRATKGIKAYILSAFKFSEDIKAEILAKICEYRIGDKISLMGFEKSISKMYSAMDVLCFPSHLHAAGRPVFESAFFQIPSIVAITHSSNDTIVHMKTGICIEPKSSESLADAIEYFYLDRSEISRMGANAYQLAVENFSASNNANKVLQLYKEIC